ncbi:uncharacterized protein BCR38DRAFT_432345 [Pseudomassariella vexata]|uniref:Uncharacterized protein n=1 Tax=Pseudomassariella vexata TaxID=1141098 RepID=A0A1Y2E1T4_9PEZI|nr:uncharacterized protein BCR38DRAFT_432345 [Pseudomassariella vexata]ORY65286.1 hypothetical protein BCR38DRAFT_432345 [Pseudomassariella vexata]
MSVLHRRNGWNGGMYLAVCQCRLCLPTWPCRLGGTFGEIWHLHPSRYWSVNSNFVSLLTLEHPYSDRLAVSTCGRLPRSASHQLVAVGICVCIYVCVPMFCPCTSAGGFRNSFCILHTGLRMHLVSLVDPSLHILNPVSNLLLPWYRYRLDAAVSICQGQHFRFVASQ